MFDMFERHLLSGEWVEISSEEDINTKYKKLADDFPDSCRLEGYYIGPSRYLVLQYMHHCGHYFIIEFVHESDVKREIQEIISRYKALIE